MRELPLPVLQPLSQTPDSWQKGDEKMRLLYSLNIPYYSARGLQALAPRSDRKRLCPIMEWKRSRGSQPKGGSSFPRLRRPSPGTTPLPGRESCPCPSWHSPARVGVELRARKKKPKKKSRAPGGKSSSGNEPKHGGKTFP